jgi:hypothetical protein
MRMRRDLRPIALTLACALVGLTANAQAAQPDACALIAPAQAGRILGTPVTAHMMDTSLAGPDAASMCRYAAKGGRGSFMLLAARLKVPNLAQEIASEKKQIRDESVKMMKITPKITDISGLGDAAFLVDSGGYMQLHVFANGNKIVVNRNAQATDKVINEIKQLARSALARLK